MKKTVVLVSSLVLASCAFAASGSATVASNSDFISTKTGFHIGADVGPGFENYHSDKTNAPTVPTAGVIGAVNLNWTFPIHFSNMYWGLGVKGMFVSTSGDSAGGPFPEIILGKYITPKWYVELNVGSFLLIDNVGVKAGYQIKDDMAVTVGVESIVVPNFFSDGSGALSFFGPTVGLDYRF